MHDEDVMEGTVDLTVHSESCSTDSPPLARKQKLFDAEKIGEELKSFMPKGC